MRRRLYALIFACSVSVVTSAAEAGLWPDAPDKVKGDLASPDVARRRAAASDLINVPRKEAIPLLQKALADSDVEVRLNAGVVAARIRMTEAGDLLIPWLTDRAPALREAACEFFAKVPDPKLVKVLARALGDSDPRVRLAAVRALGASASSDAVAPLPDLAESSRHRSANGSRPRRLRSPTRAARRRYGPRPLRARAASAHLRRRVC